MIRERIVITVGISFPHIIIFVAVPVIENITIYGIIENEIAPDFYEKEKNAGYSMQWIKYIKNTVAMVASNFTTNRMLTDYVEKYYTPLARRAELVCANDYKSAREIAGWKQLVREEWAAINVLSVVKPDSSTIIKNEFLSEVTINLARLAPEDIGVEALFATADRKGKLHIQQTVQFDCVESKDGVAKFSAVIRPDHSGSYQVALRMYPKNALLASRQDCDLVRWL